MVAGREQTRPPTTQISPGERRGRSRSDRGEGAARLVLPEPGRLDLTQENLVGCEMHFSNTVEAGELEHKVSVISKLYL